MLCPDGPSNKTPRLSAAVKKIIALKQAMRDERSMLTRRRCSPLTLVDCARALALLLSFAPSPVLAQGFSARGLSNERAATPKSVPRLLVGGFAGGAYHVGLDLALAPGVLTYWRTPGDAGVPPEFSFEGSKNVESAEVSFPAPRRIVEDGSTAFGYRREVLFPISVVPRNPSQSVGLNLVVHYATCDSVCVPAEAHQTVQLSPSIPASPDSAKIAQWAARAPEPLPAPLTPRIVSDPNAGKPRWRVIFPQPSGLTDLFVEAPDGWYFDSKGLGNGAFEISLAQAPDEGSKAFPPVVLTYEDGERAFETRVALDGSER